MPISEQEVRHVMQLARLRLSDEQVAQIRNDLESILGYVEELKSADTKNVQPMTHAVPTVPHLRDDVVNQGQGTEGLQGAAGREGAYVKVPRIVE